MVCEMLNIESIPHPLLVDWLKIVQTKMIGWKLYRTEHCISWWINYSIVSNLAAGADSTLCYRPRYLVWESTNVRLNDSRLPRKRAQMMNEISDIDASRRVTQFFAELLGLICHSVYYSIRDQMVKINMNYQPNLLLTESRTNFIDDFVALILFLTDDQGNIGFMRRDPERLIHRDFWDEGTLSESPQQILDYNEEGDDRDYEVCLIQLHLQFLIMIAISDSTCISIEIRNGTRWRLLEWWRNTSRNELWRLNGQLCRFQALDLYNSSHFRR